MVESEAGELSEDVMLGAVMFGHRGFQPVIDAIIKLAEKAAKEPRPVNIADNSALYAKVKGIAEADLRAAYAIANKTERHDAIEAVKASASSRRWPRPAPPTRRRRSLSGEMFKKLEKAIVRGDIIAKGTRIDGRDLKTVRQIVAEVGVLPRTHGSALFTRGETQALASRRSAPATTSSTSTPCRGPTRRRSCSTTTSRPTRSARPAAWVRPAAAKSATASWPGARSVRCCRRTTSSRTRSASSPRSPSSNGSSSMATVCGTSLALMDAGVPLKRPVAGIAMGLIKEEDGKFAVLSDILGDEDHLGDMDFKVAGTAEGVTSLQMDIKIQGITEEIMQIALDQAKGGRLHILGEMAKALAGSPSASSASTPRASR